jgi:hypothetical protein
VLTLLHVCNEGISDVHVSCSFAARRSSICFELLAMQWVLMYFCWSDRVSLSLDVKHPQYGGHVLMYPDRPGFSGACSVDSLSFRRAINRAFSKRCVGTSVTSHVIMNGKYGFDEPIILVQIRSLDC